MEVCSEVLHSSQRKEKYYDYTESNETCSVQFYQKREV